MPPSAAHSGCWASTGLSSPRYLGPAASQWKQLRAELQMLLVIYQEGMLAAKSMYSLHDTMLMPVTSRQNRALSGGIYQWP